MIYWLVLLDILIGNFTKYTSYFFLIFLYNKPYRYYLLTGLILDLIIFNGIYNTLILSLIYIFNKVFKDLNKHNWLNFLFITLFDYLVFIIISNLIMKSSIPIILIKIGQNLIINIIFYLMSFKLVKVN